MLVWCWRCQEDFSAGKVDLEGNGKDCINWPFRFESAKEEL